MLHFQPITFFLVAFSTAKFLELPRASIASDMPTALTSHRKCRCWKRITLGFNTMCATPTFKMMYPF
jgi:hypothetical protein